MLAIVSALLTVGNSGWFPFVIPWDDASHTVIDLAYLNAAPAGKNGRIVTREGHFVESTTGARVRFLAVNMVAAAAFPSHEDADKTAAHLAKLGINLVRFHHLQNPWSVETGGSIWKKGRVYLDLDPVQLDKLDYLFAALKKHGIYSNINLQTTRLYLPEMGFPKSVVDIAFEMDKRIDKIDRKMIELQKQYAKDLLDRQNPYTGLKYHDDPALAFVEINNENSLVGWPGEPVADQLSSLPDPFRQEIITGWNQWLAKKYGGDTGLKRAWTEGLEKPGPSILSAGAAWSTENQSNGDVKFESPNPAESKAAVAGEAASIRATVKSNSGPDWHVQIHVTGLDLKPGRAYTLRFRAKCSQDATIGVGANLDEADWHNVGLNEQVKIGNNWRFYSLAFTTNNPQANHNRVGFTLGAMRGALEIENLTLSSGVDVGPVLGGSLDRGTIALPRGGVVNRSQDFYRFLTETETAYSDEMRAYVRKDLGIKANLVDTQVAWGGVSSLVREKNSDYADNHSYWQHPSFPGKAWDGDNWLIANTPMVDTLLSGTDGLTSLAKFRFAGKPYTISEYNHPAPGDYHVEMMPLLACFAAMQDWDGFYLFEYGDFGTGKINDRIGSYFDVGLDPVRAGFIPSAALIFRAGFVNPLATTNRAVMSTEKAALAVGDPWSGTETNAWTQRLSIATEGSSGLLKGTAEHDRFIKTPDGPIFVVEEPKALAVVGHVANQTVHLHVPEASLDVTIHFGSFGRGFGAATVTFLRPAHYLLTIASRAENQDMGWNKERTTVGTKWGHGPVQVEGVPCELFVAGHLIKHIWALDATGKRLKELTTTMGEKGLIARIGPADQTIWYEMAP